MEETKLEGEAESGVSFGGRLRLFYDKWHLLTSDTIILGHIEGVTFELEHSPTQLFICPEYGFDSHTKFLISKEIDNFIAKNIIEETQHEPSEIVSNIFCRKKKSGQIRIIGNFKDINSEIKYYKFKQTTVQTIIDMLRPNQFMCSIDLTDAYYCINVNQNHRKFLKFSWNDVLYQFTCLAQGIGCAPRLFTKIMNNNNNTLFL